MHVIWFQPSRGASVVTITEHGLSFNKAAAESLGMPQYVRLGFVPEERYVVVQPTDRQDDAFPFASRLRAGSVKVNSRDFVRQLRSYVKLDLTVARRYLARWDAEDGVLIVDLNEPTDEKEAGERGLRREYSGGKNRNGEKREQKKGNPVA